MSFYPPYRWCVALNCKNSTLKTPDKLFIKVPNDVSMRHVWLELAGLDATKYSIKSYLHFCEDHFDPNSIQQPRARPRQPRAARAQTRPQTQPAFFAAPGLRTPLSVQHQFAT